MVDIALGTALAAIGAGVAIGFAGLGSGLGQGMAAAGSVGAVAEDNDMFARGIIFSALPETQAIYGFLIAILLLVFSGLLGGGEGLSTEAGVVAIGVGAAIGFAGLGSGMGQGIAASSSVGAIVEDNDMFAVRYYFLCIARDSGYLWILDCNLTYGIRWNIRLRRQSV